MLRNIKSQLENTLMKVKAVASDPIVLAILLFGFFLRIYKLGDESLWLDEAYSIIFSELSIPHLIEIVYSYDVNPPFYYLILHYWITLFGESEFVVRLPSAILGFFSIFLIYRLGSLLFNPNVGKIASLVLACSEFHIFYAQDARSYSLFGFLTLLSFYFFIKLLREETLTASIIYLLSSVVLMYSHNYGLFIIQAQNIYYFTLLILSRGKADLSFKRWILLQILLAILYAPWLVALLNQISGVRSGFWIPPPTGINN